MARFTRIVCPVDLSQYAQRALDHAMAIARWNRAHVWALHVHQLITPTFAAAPAFGAEPFQALKLSDVERRQLEASVHEWVVRDVPEGVSVESAVQDEFDVAGAIVSYAEQVGADLIAIATHGRSGFKRIVVGSVTDRVLRTARCAVLVVPPHAHEAVPRAPVAYQRIVCPVDFSDASNRAFDAAVSLAADAGGRVTVLHVVETPPELADMPAPGFSDYRALFFDRARKSLQTMTHGVQAACGVDELLLAGKPAREILRCAEEQQADLIVMGIQGRGAIDRALFGSVCQHVVRGAACPVLTVHGDK